MHLIILKQTKAYNMIQLELGVEQRRNRKFDPETEISASESDFRFRLCSTPSWNADTRLSQIQCI